MSRINVKKLQLVGIMLIVIGEGVLSHYTNWQTSASLGMIVIGIQCIND